MRFLGSFWEALGSPFGTLLGLILGSGPVLEVFGEHVGGILVPFGRLSVSTSFLDLKIDQKLSFYGLVDVAQV